MDLKRFDIRGASEDGAFMQLVDPYTREPLSDDAGEVGFMVIGNASRKAQEALRKVRSVMAKQGKKQDGLDDIHDASVRAAMAVIIEAKNLDFDGKPVGSDKTLIRAVLDATFPEIRESDDGGDIDMVNLPFATQVVKFASRQDNFLGE